MGKDAGAVTADSQAEEGQERRVRERDEERGERSAKRFPGREEWGAAQGQGLGSKWQRERGVSGNQVVAPGSAKEEPRTPRGSSLGERNGVLGASGAGSLTSVGNSWKTVGFFFFLFPFGTRQRIESIVLRLGWAEGGWSRLRSG